LYLIIFNSKCYFILLSSGSNMKFNPVLQVMLLLTASFTSLYSHAVVMNHPTFIKNGGDVNNIPNTLEMAYGPLREKALSARFDAVGKIYACTATWLGDSKDGKKSYILTGAHCADWKEPTAAKGPYVGQFKDKNGKVIAEDGVYYSGPYRINPPEEMGGNGSDIAMLVLNKKADMLDSKGQPVSQPWIYDGSEEINNTVNFLGYGNWGTGDVSANGQSPQDDFAPQEGSKRAAGESVIDELFAMDYALSAPYHPNQDSKAWARLAPGDSGSAWWQHHRGFWSIVGVTKGGSMTSSHAVRVAKYAQWIKSVYPQVRTFTSMTTVDATHELKLPDLSHEAKDSSVSYTVPKQSAATGPTDTDWDLGQGHSIIQLNLRDVNQGYYHQVNIRAWRDVGCAKAPMNSAVSCGQNQSSLVLKFMSEDNESLPAGHYQGVFTVSAQGWNDKAYTNTLTLHADIRITDEETSNPEPEYPNYQRGHAYKAGDIVTARNGKLYQCKGFPYTAYCGYKSAAYEPGKGVAAYLAWKALR
jgi:hypothetical protein